MSEQPLTRSRPDCHHGAVYVAAGSDSASKDMVQSRITNVDVVQFIEILAANLAVSHK